MAECVVEMHEEECLSSGLVDSPLSDCWVTETERSSHRHVSAARHPNKYNISAASIENRIKMEQSWQLWREFLEDYSRFKDWIQQAEAIAKEPHSSLALYTETKAELQRFECLRKRTEEQAIRLESINRRYRRLAKEQGLGLATQLKGMMHDGNQRWDNLQRRVSIICKRLKYFVSQREEFEVARENLWLQLMELDLRRNKLEYLSKDEVTERINRQQVFQQMISCISEKMDELLMAALNLLQKSEPQDAVTIEEEVWELLQFQLDVFGQVFEWELATRGASESDHHSDIIPEGQGVERRGGLLTQHPLGDPQPGHWSPFGANSLPLEWDSSVDIGGSRTYEGSVSVPCSVPDQFIDLYKGRTWGSRRVRPARRRVKADFRKVKQVDVACQCDSEINLIPGDPGPLFIEKQVVSDRFPQGICCPDDTNGFWEKQREHQNPAGLANHGGLHQGGGKPWPSLPPAVSSDEQSLAEKLRNTNGHCWMWQRFDWERTRDQNGRVHSDWLQGQTLGPRGQARCMEQWLQMLEPKPKRCDTGAGLGVTAGTDRLLHPPSVLLEGTVPPQSSSQYLLVAIALSLILLLLFFLFFLLPAVIQECDWHRKNTFLPFHFTLTYPNGPPPT